MAWEPTLMIKNTGMCTTVGRVIILYFILDLMISADTLWRVIHQMKPTLSAVNAFMNLQVLRVCVRPHLNWYRHRAINAATRLQSFTEVWHLERRGIYRDTAKVRELSETQSQISRGRGGSAQGANEGGCEKCEREGKWVCERANLWRLAQMGQDGRCE